MLAQMKERLLQAEGFEQALWTILDDTIALHGAEYGNIQLLSKSDLIIVAQRGLSVDFLRTFRIVKKQDGCACGRALRFRKPVVIPDVEIDAEFAIFREDAALAGFRAVQSTPLITGRKRLGVVSTQFANVHQPSKIEMETLQAYAALASEFAVTLLGSTPLSTMAHQLNRQLYARIETKAVETMFQAADEAIR